MSGVSPFLMLALALLFLSPFLVEGFVFYWQRERERKTRELLHVVKQTDSLDTSLTSKERERTEEEARL